MFSTCARCSRRSRIAAASTSPPHAKTVRSEDLNRRRQLVNLAVALLAMCPVALQAIALWQIAPGGAGAVDPQHAAHHAAVIMIGSARAGPLRRQQRLKPPPLFVRHI